MTSATLLPSERNAGTAIRAAVINDISFGVRCRFPAMTGNGSCHPGSYRMCRSRIIRTPASLVSNTVYR